MPRIVRHALIVVVGVSVLVGNALPVQAGSISVGPNVQVNAVAPTANGFTDNFPKNKQNEPAIARDPVTGAFIAGSNDEIDEPLCVQTGTAGGLITGSCPFSAQVGSSGVYLSPDGAHWTQPTYGGGSSAAGSGCTFTIRTLPGYCAAGLVSNGDPAIAFGPQPDGQGGFTLANGARAYYANLAFPLGNLSVGALLAVSRSDEDGASWFAPVVASSTDNPIGESTTRKRSGQTGRRAAPASALRTPPGHSSRAARVSARSSSIASRSRARPMAVPPGRGLRS